MESYPMLLPDSGNQTVLLLQQISQQLSGLSNGTYISLQDYPPFLPSTSIVCANAMWTLSLIVSIACASLAALVQQWAQRYVQIPQLRATPREQAHVRSFLFFGVEKFGMHYALASITSLLHLSVFLFFVGLVIFSFSIFTTIAIITLVSVGIFYIAYIALTILPCVHLSCPYRTPLSNLLWVMWHTVMRHITSLVLSVEAIFHIPGHLLEWREKYDCYMQDCDLRRRAGLSRSVANGAQSAPEYRELQALNWFLHVTALREDSAFQDFVSTLPEDTVRRMLQSSDPQSSTFFGGRLHDLLWTCLPGITGLTEDARKHRLLTCLDAIYRGFRAYNVDDSDESIPDSVRVNLAELRIMRPLWSDEDTAVSVRARCICALLARRILLDIGGTTPRRYPMEADIAWLEAVFGESSNDIYDSLGDLKVLGNMNVTSFVRGVKSPLLAGALTNKEITYILDTLTILMEVNGTSRTNSFQERIWVLVQRADISGSLEQLVVPLLEHLREAFPTDVGTAPPMSMPIPMSMPVPYPS
jgi:hypothetical protein